MRKIVIAIAVTLMLGSLALAQSVNPCTTLPAGLSLSTSGVIAGTPTTAQVCTFNIQACDSANPANCATAQFTITIASGLTIPPQPLPEGYIGKPYLAPALTCSGSSTGTCNWSVVQ